MLYCILIPVKIAIVTEVCFQAANKPVIGALRVVAWPATSWLTLSADAGGYLRA